MEYFFPFVFAFAISSLINRIIISGSDSLRWLIRTPSGARWHQNDTPTLGGIAMFVSFTLSLWIFRNFQLRQLIGPLDPHEALWLGGGLIFFLGLADDLRPLPPYVKLIGQISVACLMVVLGVHANLTGNPLIYIPLTVFWFVAITNAFNLLDNMDGLAAGVAFIASCTLAWIGLTTGGPLSELVVFTFAASVLGFLWFNFHPAKIFMGDCGSQWIGFMMAGFSILDTWKSASNLFLILATPALVLAVPIFDTALVTLNRKIHGRPVSQGGKDHSSHRMVALGLSEQKTVAFLWALAAGFGLSAYLALLFNVETWLLIVGSSVVLALVLGIFLTEAKVYEAGSETRNPRSRLLKFDFNLLYKRRVVEIFIDTIIIGGAYILAYLIRFDWELGSYQFKLMTNTLPLVIAAKLTALFLVGFYRGLWTYIDFEGFAKLVRSCFLASVASLLVVIAVYRFEGFSRTLFLIDFCLLLVLMGGVRAFLRSLRESVFSFPDEGLRVLVIGAGAAGRQLLQEIRRRRDWNLRPVAILDDDARKAGNKIVGIRVLGPTTELESVLRDQNIQQVIMAMPSAPPAHRNSLEMRCLKANVPTVAIQSIEDSVIRRIG